MKKVSKVDAVWASILVIFVCLTIFVFGNHNIWSVEVLAACLGAVITIIATRLLLYSQSKIDENNKRQFEVYNTKLKVYSDFVSWMYEILSDNVITEKEMLEFRTRLFGNISFYANQNIMEEINQIFTEVSDYTEIEKMQGCFAQIANLLQKDLRSDCPLNVDSSVKLWNTFNGLLDESVSSEEVLTEEKISNGIVDTIGNQVPQCINQQFWHFNMLGESEQLQALSERINELNLIEVQESWRTDLLKKVNDNDLIFLFRTGGKGYMGVYRAIGKRLFTIREDKTIVEELYDRGEKKVITDQDKCKSDLERSDIYGVMNDVGKLVRCSSIIIEPLCFTQRGVGNPGSVYRRTISRYDRGFGLRLLSRFMTIIEDGSEYDKYYKDGQVKSMGCNKEMFTTILKSGGITPAPRNEQREWL